MYQNLTHVTRKARKAHFKDCEYWDMPETYFTTSKEGE